MKTLFTAALAALSFSACASDPYAVRIAVPGSYADVRDALRFAIEGKGLSINHTNQIAGMLDRTGMDLGASKRVYEAAEQFEFCSAALSRAMMEADPHAVTLCPYIVSVYKLPGDASVYVAFRKPPATANPELAKALAGVEALLNEIAAESR